MGVSSKKYHDLMMLIVIIIFLFVFSSLIVILFKTMQIPINDDDVILNSDSNTIILKSFVTVNDDFGKTISDDNGGYYGYLEFSVENKVNDVRNFQIYLKRADININSIAENYIKLYLTDFEDNYDSIQFDNKIPRYDNLMLLSDMPENRLLYSGFLKGNSMKKFKIRVWISNEYTINDDDASFAFVVFTRAV